MIKSLRFALPLLFAVLALPAFAASQEPYVGSWPVFSTYDIRAYGAVGDGTTDDTQAIQAAELAAETQVANCGGGSGKCGAVVLIPCGNYYIKTGPVTISSNGGSGSVKWMGMCGPLTYSESASYAGPTLVNKGDTVTSATVTATIASPSVFTGATLPNGTVCWLSTTSNLPGAFTPYLKYYVVATSGNTFELALTSGGAAINGTGSQAGTHTVYCGKRSSVTVTSASPGVVTWTSHGLIAGQSFFFGGTTAPTGTTAGTQYFVSPTGLAANTFQFCTTSPALAGTCTSVNTSSTGTAVVAQLFPDTVFANANASLDFQGPKIEDVGFVGTAGTASFHADNFMHGLISHSSFRDGGWGVFLEGVADNSDWIINNNTLFRNNGVSIDCAVSTTGGCNNGYIGNYFNTTATGQISIRSQGGNAQLRVIGNKFDSNSGQMSPAVVTQSNQTLVLGNDFENPAPAVLIPWSPVPASNNGRGLRIVANQIGMGGGGPAISVGTLSCTTANSSTSVTSCSGGTLSTTASLAVGMIVSGTCVNTLTGGAGTGPFVYGAGGAGTATNPSTMTGINVVAAITSTSALTLGQNTGTASCGAGTTLSFAYPQYYFPSGSAMPYPVVVNDNSYIGCGNVPDVNHCNDGG